MASDPYDLKFSRGDNRYCMDIANENEIIDADVDITSVPNADPQVAGVVDLRGQTTTVVDPKVALSVDGETFGRRIVVLSGHDGKGLLIDDVHEVERVNAEAVDESTARRPHGALSGVKTASSSGLTQIICCKVIFSEDNGPRAPFVSTCNGAEFGVIVLDLVGSTGDDCSWFYWIVSGIGFIGENRSHGPVICPNALFEE